MSTSTEARSAPDKLDRVVVRFAGDSGDGMQLVGDRFTELSALFGNDLATLPNYPAEIRAPAGTVAGVSSFQVHISGSDVVTPGDAPNVLVAMNPAALQANLDDLDPGSTIIVNIDSFEARDLGKAGLDHSPLEDGIARRVHRLRGPDDLDHPAGDRGPRREAPRRGALQELLRPRADLLDVHPSRPAARRLDRSEVPEQAERARREPGGPAGGAELR